MGRFMKALGEFPSLPPCDASGTAVGSGVPPYASTDPAAPPPPGMAVSAPAPGLTRLNP